MQTAAACFPTISRRRLFPATFAESSIILDRRARVVIESLIIGQQDDSASSASLRLAGRQHSAAAWHMFRRGQPADRRLRTWQNAIDDPGGSSIGLVDANRTSRDRRDLGPQVLAGR